MREIERINKTYKNSDSSRSTTYLRLFSFFSLLKNVLILYTFMNLLLYLPAHRQLGNTQNCKKVTRLRIKSSKLVRGVIIMLVARELTFSISRSIRSKNREIENMYQFLSTRGELQLEECPTFGFCMYKIFGQYLMSIFAVNI